ncbi:MAG: PQQ-binding-like beta-propeller repeat protein [Lentisphaeria bacterium]
MKLLHTICLCVVTTLAYSADWPQFRGPKYNGVSTESDLDFVNMKEKWRADVHTGFSAVTVVDGRVYTMGNKKGTDHIVCLDEETGETVWIHTYACKLAPRMYEGGPNATPTIKRGKVYTLSREGHMICLDAATGDVLWERHAREFNAESPSWGFSGSTTVVGKIAVYNVGSGGVGLDADSGKTLWGTGSSDAGYATPLPVKLDGKQQIAIFTGKRVVGLDPRSGKELWEFVWKTSYDVNAADPIFMGNRFFVSSGYGTGAAVAQVRNGKVKKLWRNKVMRSHFNNCVFWQGYLYGLSGKSGTRAKLVCVDPATGDVKWQHRGIDFGSILIADGKLIILNESGNLFIADPNPEEYKELHQDRPVSGKFWTTPTVANGCLYIRNAKGKLTCFDLNP